MSQVILTLEAKRENAAMLAAALGQSLDEAAEALELTILITANTSDPVACLVGRELELLLSRTIQRVALNELGDAPSLEIVIGAAEQVTSAPSLGVGVSQRQVIIGTNTPRDVCEGVPHIFAVISASYAAGAAIQAAMRGRLPFSSPNPLIVDFSAFGVTAEALKAPIELGHAYMAGAGAIGNAFLWAARCLDLRGQLELVDDDTVSSGNLNRQIWFNQRDIGHGKAGRLASHAQPYFKSLKLVPRKARLQDLSERSDEPWLQRLIVAVDSRRARRNLQDEFPGEVFDASTTDIREVVLHHHKQVTKDACLSCIYEPDSEESSREQHIADHLGVSLGEVREERIAPHSAAKIVAKYPHMKAEQLTGIAYDTLFKQLCGEGHLRTLEGRRVVAPFAFVSVLAGCLLALEIVRRLTSAASEKGFNYWRVSPWYPPLRRRQVQRPRQAGCAFCGSAVKQRVNTTLWDR